MRVLKCFVVATFILLVHVSLRGQGDEVVFLWSSRAPIMAMSHDPEQVRIAENGEHVVTNIHAPSITAFIPSPEIATGVAVIIAPGGGHRELWIDHEGFNVAMYLKERGIASFVLKYRLENANDSEYTVDEHALADMHKAIEIVRSKSQSWNISRNKVGVMGFSAGGELAGLSAMSFEETNRPDFQALIYPGRAHKLAVTENSPPVFLACGANDRADISERLPEIYLEYKRSGIPAELHIYASAGHGFGLRASNKGAMTLWPDQFLSWLEDLKILD